ncbi:MAG: DUF1080 domain-containing protein [Acidobacteriota bacterium]
MKRFLIAFAVIAAFAVAASTDALNTLTKKEAAQGWKMMWDGKTLDGLKVYGNATWTIKDGALVSGGPGGWLGTADDYSNFALKGEFRTSEPHINSGIYIRRSRDAGDSHMMGYEMQIRNAFPNDKPYDGKSDNHNGYYTGSFSGHLKSHKEPVIEMGKWNTVELTAEGDHFVVVINGNKVLDDHQASFKTGAIGLQHTGQQIEFRNLKIKTL